MQERYPNTENTNNQKILTKKKKEIQMIQKCPSIKQSKLPSNNPLKRETKKLLKSKLKKRRKSILAI